jgi:hypothetical protein
MGKQQQAMCHFRFGKPTSRDRDNFPRRPLRGNLQPCRRERCTRIRPPATGQLTARCGSAHSRQRCRQAALCPHPQTRSESIADAMRGIKNHGRRLVENVTRAARVFLFVYAREQNLCGNAKMIECPASAAALLRAPAWQALSLKPRVVARV